jgi:hypothetical protein
MGGQKIENGCGTELIRKLPEPWRCSLIEADEPDPDLAHVKRHEGQPEGVVKVGEFWLSYSCGFCAGESPVLVSLSMEV